MPNAALAQAMARGTQNAQIADKANAIARGIRSLGVGHEEQQAAPMQLFSGRGDAQSCYFC